MSYVTFQYISNLLPKDFVSVIQVLMDIPAVWISSCSPSNAGVGHPINEPVEACIQFNGVTNPATNTIPNVNYLSSQLISIINPTPPANLTALGVIPNSAMSSTGGQILFETTLNNEGPSNNSGLDWKMIVVGCVCGVVGLLVVIGVVVIYKRVKERSSEIA